VVASVWHKIGMAHAGTGNGEAAEHAYKKSLALWAALCDSPNEAKTLHQLGMLYSDQGRLEDAAALYQQAVDMKRKLGDRLNEGISLSDLGIVLHALHRFDEAREAFTAALAVLKLYGHAGEPWKTWWEIEDMERDAGQPEAAREARQQALQTYRAYRADGGEPSNGPTRFVAAFGQTLRESGPAAARVFLDRTTEIHDQFAPTFRALHAIAAGSRDPALADDPAHHPFNAVERALLLESLPPAAPPPAPLGQDAPCPCGSGTPFPLCHGADAPTVP
jgi:tetratricopeptide (TPR) repeat protein